MFVCLIGKGLSLGFFQCRNYSYWFHLIFCVYTTITDNFKLLFVETAVTGDIQLFFIAHTVLQLLVNFVSVEATVFDDLQFLFVCSEPKYTYWFKLFLFAYAEPTVTGEVLSLPPVTREDMGNYMCIAQNGVPPAISKSYKLIVNCKEL